jgi:tetratricopeptide (TPR) repeat protein
MIMNKRLMIAAVGIIFCAVVCASGQTVQPADGGMKRRMIPTRLPWESPKELAARYAAVKARETEIARLDEAGIAALKVAQYAEAEDDARQSVALGLSSGRGIQVLAAALDAQGKTSEALAAYKRIAEMGDDTPQNELPYALLLLKTGHWAQAVRAYERQLPNNADKGLMRPYSDFSPTVPRPKELTAAIHIELGLATGWGGYHGVGNERRGQALAQLQQGLALEPKWAVAHLFYGRQLWDMGRRSEAQAAFRKAAALDQGDVKAAAEQAMQMQRPVMQMQAPVVRKAH